MSNIVPMKQPVVRADGDEVLASSRDVAAYFERRHKDVLESIDKLLELQPKLRERHFRPTQINVEMPTGGTRDIRGYEMANQDWRSIKAHAAIIGRKITTKESGELGKAATALSKQQGAIVGKQFDEHFGTVNTYHISILDQIFKEIG